MLKILGQIPKNLDYIVRAPSDCRLRYVTKEQWRKDKGWKENRVKANKRGRGEQRKLQAEDSRKGRGRLGRQVSEKMQIKGCKGKEKERRGNVKDYYRNSGKECEEQNKEQNKWKKCGEKRWKRAQEEMATYETWSAHILQPFTQKRATCFFIHPSKQRAGSSRHHSTICSDKENATDTETEKMKTSSKKEVY